MPNVNLVRAFVVQWWTIGIVLLYLSLVVVGAIEAVAAVLFLIPRTLRIGAIGLLLVFAVVLLIHALQFQFRGDIAIYAAAVLFVAVHGSVPKVWLRARA